MISKINQNGRKLALQTREANDIENFQPPFLELTLFVQKQIEDAIEAYKPKSTRSSATPCYNCHGLTFASRRTGIYKAAEIRKILKEDKYIEINRRNTLPGDIIVYCSDDGDIEHSGIVLSEPNGLSIPLVVSKWGNSPEFVHWANQCPYSFQNALIYRIEK